jgi:hypothetical protein
MTHVWEIPTAKLMLLVFTREGSIKKVHFPRYWKLPKKPHRRQMYLMLTQHMPGYPQVFFSFFFFSKVINMVGTIRRGYLIRNRGSRILPSPRPSRFPVVYTSVLGFRAWEETTNQTSVRAVPFFPSLKDFV